MRPGDVRPSVRSVKPPAVLPALGLFVLAPWMAEFSWGGLGPADLPAAVLFLGPLYGCAAILVREIARRTGRGWSTMLLLGAAFGVVQAGVVDQSMFNPYYLHYDFQHPAHVPGLGISALYALSFVVGHAVVSIGVPIALIETYAVGRGGRPWLGRWGLAVVAAGWALASVLNHVDVRAHDGHGFQASPGQTAGAVAVGVGLVFLALTQPRSSTRPGPPSRWARPRRAAGLVPPPWAVAAGAFLTYLLWLPHESWLGVAVAAVVLPTVAAVLTRWSRRARWGVWHTFAVAAGVVLVGPVSAFTGEPYEQVPPRTELLNDTVAALIALCLVVAGALVLHRHAREVLTGPGDRKKV